MLSLCPSGKKFSGEDELKRRWWWDERREAPGSRFVTGVSSESGGRVKAPECFWAEQRRWRWSSSSLSSTSRCLAPVCRCAAPPSPSSPAASPASPGPCAAPSASSWRWSGRSGWTRPAPAGRHGRNLAKQLTKRSSKPEFAWTLGLRGLHF